MKPPNSLTGSEEYPHVGYFPYVIHNLFHCHPHLSASLLLENIMSFMVCSETMPWQLYNVTMTLCTGQIIVQ